MTQKIALSGEEWVELRDVGEVRNRDRTLIILWMEKYPEGTARGYAHADGVLASLVESWSFELPVPRLVADGVLGVVAENIESLGEITPRHFDEIAMATAEHRKALFPRFDAEADEGPGSPFEPSNASEES